MHDELWVKDYGRYEFGAAFPQQRTYAPIGPEWDAVIWVAASTPSHFR